MTLSLETRNIRVEAKGIDQPGATDAIKAKLEYEFDADFTVTYYPERGFMLIDGMWAEDAEVLDVINEAGYTVTYALAM